MPLLPLSFASALFALILPLCWIAGVVASLLLVLGGLVVWRRKRARPGLHWWEVGLQVALEGVFRGRYRFRIEGLENIPATGGVILAPNHVSYLDAVLLPMLCPRPVRILSFADYEKSPVMRRVTRFFNTIPVSPAHAKEAIRLAAERLAAGDCLCIWPEGQLTRNGSLGAFQGGCALMARRAQVPVVPVYVDGLWGSLFSFSKGRVLKKWPRRGRPAVTVVFGRPIPAEAADSVRERVQELGVTAYSRRPMLQQHLGSAVVQALARHPNTVVVVDRSGPVRTPFKAAVLLAAARWCARKWRKDIPETRVGIVLPPGIGTTVANVVCVLLGKSPVNLNFTLGRAQVEASIAKTGVRTLITAAAFRSKLDEKVPDFPWQAMERVIDIGAELKAAPRSRLAVLAALVYLLPGWLLCRLWRVPRQGGDREAAVLCTSGSSGQPKGVPLSHANILGNCAQFEETDIVPPKAVLLGNLPIFHSFGFTVSLWFGLTRCIRVVNTPSPLEVARNIAAVRDEQVSLIIGTPTFFRSYLKKASRADMASVLFVVAGAEKTPSGFAREWEERFGSRYLEGYGATETTPVASVGLFDLRDPGVSGGIFYGNRAGSVGRLLCGQAARFTSPFSGEAVPFREGGVLWLRGVNVFSGYLDDPARTREVLTSDGWYCTGDIARIDLDGFLFIEGRQARFSKIGGEMVPHGTVENAIRRVLGLHFADDAQQRVAVSARFDETKGESLVLLTTLDIDADKLRSELAADGLANLWIPRYIKRVEAIPVLATGKLDLQQLKALAAEEG